MLLLMLMLLILPLPIMRTCVRAYSRLQHTAPCLWGFGKAGSKVVITATSSVIHATSSATVQANGTWKSCLKPQPPSYTPATVTVAMMSVGAADGNGHASAATLDDAATATLSDVLFGDVWVASGQSNMAFSVKQAFNHTAECADAATWKHIRLFTVAVNADWHKYHAGEPADFNVSGIRQQWSVASPDSVCGGGDFDFFSAAAYFFCRNVQQSQGIPIGCLATSVPGTSIELWSSEAALSKCPLSKSDGGKASGGWSEFWDAMVRVKSKLSSSYKGGQGRVRFRSFAITCEIESVLT